MDSAKLNDWMQVVGILAVVGSLIFVGLQMRQDRNIAMAEALSSRSAAISELAALIGSNKALWISGLNDDELSEEDRAAFQAMAEAVESYFVALYVRLATIPRSSGLGPQQEEPISNYAFALYLHKGLRRTWNTQQDYWQFRDSAFSVADGGNDFRRRVDAKLAQLDKDAPPTPVQKRYVFW